MNTPTQQSNTCRLGFSFIEVLLSLALVASSLVTLMALVPMGLKASRNATNSVIMAHILEDAHERLEGHLLVDGDIDSEPFFYDNEGIFLAPFAEKNGNSNNDNNKIAIAEQNKENATSGSNGQNARIQRRLYRVDIRLVSPADEVIQEHAPGLKAVILTVAWPVDPVTGDVLSSEYSRNRESITYYVNALTGPGWNKVDPEFKALIEF